MIEPKLTDHIRAFKAALQQYGGGSGECTVRLSRLEGYAIEDALRVQMEPYLTRWGGEIGSGHDMARCSFDGVTFEWSRL